ncbi:MAG: hypothetical protein ACREOC_13555 [Gemmatimonadales bacterium]
MKGAAWIAGALAFGWLATVIALAFPGGHPPLAYFVGAGVVLVSFVAAPIGAGAALAGLWRARRQGTRTPRLAVAALVLNVLFLVVAIALWFWIRWVAARR